MTVLLAMQSANVFRAGNGGRGARQLEVNVIQEETGGGVSEIRLGKFPFPSF